MDNSEALRIARDAFASSTSYVDANFRNQWEDALKMFQSKHPANSKYNSETYKYRSRIFRPKTRSVIRKNEAAAANAFFSNLDVVDVTPANPKEPKSIIGAALYKELLQYRLTKSIPWFMTLVGGFQDALTVGVVCSYQSWKFRSKTEKQDQMFVDEMGNPMMGIDGPITQTVETQKVLEDRPCVELLPVENLRIDRGSSWTDPVNTSPYLIHMIPMYVGDLKEMGKPNQKTGEDGWKIPDDSILLAATQSYDTTRQAREDQREDSKDQDAALSEFGIVWVHKNIVRDAGEDVCYYTLGTEHLLSPPVPLEKYYFHGERPYVMGCAVLETHKIYPAGFPELGKELQKETNEIANSRLDNVKLVLNKRYVVKRGAQVDLKSLVRNVAGSVTLANTPKEDVVAFDFEDVTSSSYAEQDRLNVDYDELLGNFSSGSVQTNRKLNETVGGMQIMAQGANQLTEYTIRTFTETWVEPVLKQLVKLEKHYETDETIVKLMGQKIGVQLNDDSFDTDVEINVNVGMGATDPMQKLNKLLIAARGVAEVVSMAPAGLNVEELGKEIFSAVGYRDGGRFLGQAMDPRLQQAQQIIQELQQKLAEAEQQLQSKMAELQLKAQESQQEMMLDRAKTTQELMLAREKANADLSQQMIELKAGLLMEVQKIKADFIAKMMQVQATAAAKPNGGGGTTIIPNNLHEAFEKLSKALSSLPQKFDVDAKYLVNHKYEEKQKKPRRIRIRQGQGDEMLAEEI